MSFGRINRTNYTTLQSDAGSASETRIHDDEEFPDANGGLTWSATDPLGAGDLGGKARFWARVPDGSGGFWVRDDWNALTATLDDDNRINLGWAELDPEEDITTIWQQIHTDYDDIFIEPPLYVGSVVIDALDLTAITVDTLDIKDCKRSFQIRPAAWPWGTESLMTPGNWTEGATNIWTHSVVETVARLFIEDPVDHHPSSNNNTASGTWLCDCGPPESVSGNVDVKREWHYGSGTLTVFSESNPASRFNDIQYTTDTTIDLDHIWKYDNVTTVNIRGRLGGLEFVGRAGHRPLARAFQGGITEQSMLFFDTSGAAFNTGAGSFYWSAPIRNEYGYGLELSGTAGNRVQGYETFTLASRVDFSTKLSAGIKNFVLDDWGHPLGIREPGNWGSTFGALASTRDRSAPNDSISAWYDDIAGNPTLYVNSQTGAGVHFPIFAVCSRIGNGASVPYVQHVWHPPGYTSAEHTPNSRPYLIADANSATVLVGKVDGTFNDENSAHVRVVFHVDLWPNVDRNDQDNPGLNLAWDGATNMIGNRAGWTLEATGSNNTGQGQMGWVVTFVGDVFYPLAATLIQSNRRQDFSGLHQFTQESGNTYKAVTINHGDTLIDFNFPEAPTSFVSLDDIAVNVGASQSYNFFASRDCVIQDATLGQDRYIFATKGVKNLQINGMTCSGTAIDRVEVNPYEVGEFEDGIVSTIIADDVSGWVTSDAVVMSGAQATTNTYFSDDGGSTWWDLPYTVGGSNTVKGFPPSLLRMGYHDETFAAGTSDQIVGPVGYQDGEHLLIALGWDGDPGTITPPSGATLVSSNNTTANDLYAAVYTMPLTAALAWSGYNDTSKLFHAFSWVNSVAGTYWVVHHRGQSGDAIGASDNSVQDSASTTATCPTITHESSNSMNIAICMAIGSATASNFAGSLSPWDVLTDEPSAGNYGVSGSAVSIMAAEHRRVTNGSTAGCVMTKTSTKHITFSIELKAKAQDMTISATSTGSATLSDQLNP